MSDRAADTSDRFEQELVISASPSVVFRCFFRPDALRAWWQTVRSVTTPVHLGVFAVEWATTPYRDELLGALGGVFHGTIVELKPDKSFLVADAWWVPPEGDPIGPMALEVNLEAIPAGCRLHVRQSGYDPSPRWRRYYAVVSRGWQISLIALKRYAETQRA